MHPSLIVKDDRFVVKTIRECDIEIQIACLLHGVGLRVEEGQLLLTYDQKVGGFF